MNKRRGGAISDIKCAMNGVTKGGARNRVIISGSKGAIGWMIKRAISGINEGGAGIIMMIHQMI